jgi:hypothetical protein
MIFTAYHQLTRTELESRLEDYRWRSGDDHTQTVIPADLLEEVIQRALGIRGRTE